MQNQIDDRRYWLMQPSHARYETAKLTEMKHPCRCGLVHQAAVYTDGTLYCQESGDYFVATADQPVLKAMRRNFEDDFIAMCRATELN